MKTNPGERVVHGADSAERVNRNQPSQRQTGDGYSYRKSFEIRLDEIDFNGHLHNTKYLEYCSHTRYCQLVEQGWDLRRMGEHGIGAVSLADDIHYPRQVRLGDLITVTYQSSLDQLDHGGGASGVGGDAAGERRIAAGPEPAAHRCRSARGVEENLRLGRGVAEPFEGVGDAVESHGA